MQNFDVLDGGGPAAVRFRAGTPDLARQKAAIVFVDPSATDVSALMLALEKRSDRVFLNAEQDGLEQMAGHLNGRSRLSLVHVLANFSRGRLALGNKVLVIRSLRDATATLRRIGRALAGSGEIVIGTGGMADGQSENFRRAFEGYATVPVRLWEGGARRCA